MINEAPIIPITLNQLPTTQLKGFDRENFELWKYQRDIEKKSKILSP